MKILNHIKHPRTLAIFVMLLCFISASIFLRSTYVSEKLAVIITKTLQEKTSIELSAQRYYINLIPVYIGAEDISASSDGIDIVSIKRVKAYVDIVALMLLSPEVDRIIIESPDVDIASDTISKLSSERKNDSNVSVNRKNPWAGVIVLRDGSLVYRKTGKDSPLMVNGLDLEISTDSTLSMVFNMDQLIYDIPSKKWPEIAPSMRGHIAYGNNAIEVKRFSARLDDSLLKVTGLIHNAATPQMDGELDLNLSLKPESIRSSFNLSSNTSGLIEVSGTVALSNSVSATSIDLEAKGDFYLEMLLESLGVKSKVRDRLKARLVADVNVSGYLSKLKGRAIAIVSEGMFYDVQLDKAKAAVLYQDGQFIIKSSDASVYGGEADIDVSFNVLRKKSPVGVDVAFRGAQSDKGLARIHLDNIGLPPGRVDGEIVSHGRQFYPEGWVNYRSTGVLNTPLGQTRFLSGGFHSQGHRLHLDDFKVQSENSIIRFDGFIDTDDKDLGFVGNIVSTNAGEFFAPYAHDIFRGNAVADIIVNGTVDDLAVESSIHMTQASLNGRSIGNISGHAVYTTGNLGISSLDIVKGMERVIIKGDVLFPDAIKPFDMKKPLFAITVDASHVDISNALAYINDTLQVEGSVNAALSVGGSLSDPLLSGKLWGKNIIAYDRLIDSALLRFQLDRDSLSIKNALAYMDDGIIDSTATVSMDGDYNIDLTGLNVSTKRVFLNEMIPDYSVFMNATAVGSLDDIVSSDVELRASLRDGGLINQPIGDGSISLSLHKKIVDGRVSLVDNKLNAEGQVSFRPKNPWKLDIDLDYDRYDPFITPFVSWIPRSTIVALMGKIKLSGNADEFHADIALHKGNVNIFNQGFANIDPIEVSVNNRVIEFKRFHMRGAHAEFSTSGIVEIGNRIDMHVSGDVSLLILARYLNGVSDTKGKALMDVEISGPLNAPVMKGDFSLADASLALTGMPQRLTDINALVRFDAGRAVVENATASFGGGIVECAGRVDLIGTKIDNINLETTAKDVSARFSPNFNADINGALLLTGNGETSMLSGEINITKALYRERVEWKKWLIGGRGVSAAGKVSWKDNVKLNVRFYGNESLKVDNNLASAPIAIDLIYLGTLASPRPIGRIEARGGKIFFRNAELELINATADYTDESNKPLISLVSQDSIKGYDIMLTMEGRIDRMDLQFSSTPALDDNEILALLTYGDLGSSAGGLESGLGAAEATFLLTGEMQELMEDRMTMFTGLDRFQIDPYLSSSTGTVTPRLTASKKLFNDKVNMTYSSTLETIPEQEIKLEYLLGENVSVLAGQDYTGSLGGDLKFRFSFE